MIDKPTENIAIPFDSYDIPAEGVAPKTAHGSLRANDLSGKEWTRNSISIWSDIRKDSEELSLNHPATFPKSLVLRLLESFTRREQELVFDPFCGSGSTVLAASLCGKRGIGMEINPDYIALTKRRYQVLTTKLFNDIETKEIVVYEADARNLLSFIAASSLDICITSPPYWDVLTQRRTADSKTVRNYGDHALDLGRVRDYHEFIAQLTEIFSKVQHALKPKGYCLINVMDIRKGPVFYPFHSDLASALCEVGFKWDDVIIWDRRTEYNYMRPLGYPTVYRINKAHEYILIMQKVK